jgi:hypothetical protein
VAFGADKSLPKEVNSGGIASITVFFATSDKWTLSLVWCHEIAVYACSTVTCACAYYCRGQDEARADLMEPVEFAALERLARSRGSSVADLIREAARAQYLDVVDRSP